MLVPSANPTPPMPAQSDAAATQELIQQIAAEARSSGKSVVYDPDAPPETDGEGAPPAKPAKGKPPARAEGEGNSESESTDETETAEASDPDQETDEGAEDDAQEHAAEAGEVDLSAVTAALNAEGGVDMLALANALGKRPEDLGVSPGAAKFLRIEKKKASDTLSRANALAERLQRDFGDQVAARKAVETGQLEPAIEFIQNTFGMDWNELNKAVGALLQGKPVPGVEEKRKLREYEKREAERVAAEKKQASDLAAQQKVGEAKKWIQGQIKGDKLASEELDRQLREAGFPSVVDLVFEEMQQNYSKGLTDPKKALEKVRAKLTKQAKALRTAGLVPKAPPPKTAPVSGTSKPRANAQTGMAGNGRAMTDAELRQAVLKEHGLLR